MAEPARRLATYDDLARIPEGIHVELRAGEIYTFPSGRPRHGFVAAGPTYMIGPFGFDPDGPGGWWIISEVDVSSPDTTPCALTWPAGGAPASRPSRKSSRSGSCRIGCARSSRRRTRGQDGGWLRLGAWGDGDRARIRPFDAVEIDVGRGG